MANLGQSIRDSATWVLGGNLAGQIVGFGMGIVLARLLQPSDFGLLVTIQIFTGIVGFVAGAGLGQALIQAQEVKHADFQAVFTAQLVIGLAIYAVFFVVAPWFAIWFDNPIYRDLLRVTALYFILRPFGNLSNVWLTREMRFKEKTVVWLSCSTLGSLTSIVFAWMGFHVWSLVIGGMIGTIAATAILLAMIPVRPRLRLDLKSVNRFATYGVKTTLNDFVSYLRSQACNFVLSRVDGPTMVGLYNKAESLMRTPFLISGSVYDPMFRGMANLQDDKDKCRYLYFRTVTLLAVYMLPLFVGLAWLAEPFVLFVYGPKWIEAAKPLSILCLGGAFGCIGYPSGAVLAAQNWLGREVIVHAITLVLATAAAYFGFRWGLIGVAWGMVAVYVYGVAHISWLVKRCIGARFGTLLHSLLPALLLNSILCAVLLITQTLLPRGFASEYPGAYLFTMSIAGATTYAVAFLFLPLSALASEQVRWKRRLGTALEG